MIDIVKVKSEIKKGILKVEINGTSVLLTHPMSGESVKIADLKDFGIDVSCKQTWKY